MSCNNIFQCPTHGSTNVFFSEEMATVPLVRALSLMVEQ